MAEVLLVTFTFSKVRETRSSKMMPPPTLVVARFLSMVESLICEAMELVLVLLRRYNPPPCWAWLPTICTLVASKTAALISIPPPTPPAVFLLILESVMVILPLL